jgi:hypothetical protein
MTYGIRKCPASSREKSIVMNQKQDIKISIPTQCLEDWNKMTPNQQGAFCGNCCKTVIDFTEKTDDEIKAILLASTKEKICGRFTNKQLSQPEQVQANVPVAMFTSTHHAARIHTFAIALFIVFGSTLFSCGTNQDAVVGEIAADSTTTKNKLDTAKGTTEIPTCKTAPEDMITGEIAIKQGEVEMVVPDTVKPKVIKPQEEAPCMGKIKVSK